MAWYWYWVIFLIIASSIFYFFFYIFPTVYRRTFEAKVKEKNIPSEEEIFTEDDPIKPCPICTQEMTKDSLNGIIVDRCPLHGIWFDKGELKSVVDFVKSGGNIDGFFSGLGVDP